MLTILAVAFLVWLVFGYFGYGRWIAKQFVLDDARPTPAHELNDGEDYVTDASVLGLFGQPFKSAIARRTHRRRSLHVRFGLLPCLIGSRCGVVLIGAVHDFSALTARSGTARRVLPRSTNDQLDSGRRAMMAFSWYRARLWTVAFTRHHCGNFRWPVTKPRRRTRFNPGGRCCARNVLYLGLSIVLGLVERFFKPPLWLTTVIFVPATFALSYVGTMYSHVLSFGHQTWAVVILVYCVAASLMPVWALLQPRGYLGGFVLYSAIAVGVVGIFFGGYAIQQPAFKSFDVGGLTGMLFPFLFVTIACGACSGFHGLVCSGTTSKQIDKETHARPVGYGGMLAEGFVAFIALVTVMVAASDSLVGPDADRSRPEIYGNESETSSRS